MKKILLLLITSLFLVIQILADDPSPLLADDPSSQPNIELYFNSYEAVQATTSTYYIYDMERALLDKINRATIIQGALYSINRPWIIYALCGVENRDGIVELVADKKNYHEDYSYWFNQLENCGVEIKPSTSSSLMHNKFLIFDNESVWSGSVNMTNTGFTYNANNGLIFNDPNVASLFKEEWEQMYIEEKFSTRKEPVYGTFNYEDGTQIEIYFSPKYDVESYLYNMMIEELNTSFYASIFYWTNRRIGDAFLTHRPSNDKVNIAWEANGFNNEYSVSHRFCEWQVPIRVETFGGKIHNKFMVFDLETVVTGTCNFSNSCFYQNDEHIIVIRNNANLVRQYAYQASYLYHSIPSWYQCHEHSAEWSFPACFDGIDNDYDDYLDQNDWDCQ